MGRREQNPNFYKNKELCFDLFETNDKQKTLTKKEDLLHNLFCVFNKISKEIDFFTFEIGFSWPSFIEIPVDFKSSVRWSVIDDLLIKKLGKEHKKEGYEAYFLIDFMKNLVFIYLSPVFVYGKYCKFSRDIAQTEHFCRFCHGKKCPKCDYTGLLTQNSVEQILSEFLIPFFKAKQLILHGAGREDVDVRMLGEGRPFVLEIICPVKRFVDIKKLEEKINSFEKNSDKRISVNSLEIVSREKVPLVKNSFYDKIYSAIVSSNISSNDLDKIILNKKFFINQETPTRVEKRRVLMNRKKEITFLKKKKISSKEFEIVLKTSHGTYVKEFISGDSEKTKPSLSSILGKKCHCKELDVLEICIPKN